MPAPSARCPACGEDTHGPGRCPRRAIVEVVMPGGKACNCLPAAPAGWLACASCGLPQAPGKAFCGFCGRRWVTDDRS